MLNCLVMFLLAVQLNTYTDKVNGFKCNYPLDWKEYTMANSIAFLSPKENKSDSFQENVSITIQDLSSNSLTLEQYTALTKEQIISTQGKGAINSLKDAFIAKQKAKQFNYNLTFANKHLRIKQFWFIKDKKAYLITYTAQPHSFERYEKIADEIIASLTLF